MSALKWQNDPPTVPGWWWVQEPNGRVEVAYVAVASWLGGRLFAITTGAAPPVDKIHAKWAGPIPEPEETP